MHTLSLKKINKDSKIIAKIGKPEKINSNSRYIYLTEIEIEIPNKSKSKSESKSKKNNLIKGLTCPNCFKNFSRNYNMRTHMKKSCIYGKLEKIKLVNDLKINKDDLKINKDELIKKVDFEEKIFIMPQDYQERFYICSNSGSGKSFFCANYAKAFKKKFPDKPIILLSTIGDDVVFENIDFCKIDIDEDLLLNPICVKEELASSLIIMDDIDNSFNSDELNKYMFNLRDDILKNGRDQSSRSLGMSITIMCTNHKILDHNKTSLMISEATCYVLYPRSGCFIDDLLKKYCGLSIQQIKRIKNIEKTRWVCIFKRYPMYCIHEFGVFLL